MLVVRLLTVENSQNLNCLRGFFGSRTQYERCHKKEYSIFILFWQ